MGGYERCTPVEARVNFVLYQKCVFLAPLKYIQYVRTESVTRAWKVILYTFPFSMKPLVAFYRGDVTYSAACVMYIFKTYTPETHTPYYENKKEFHAKFRLLNDY